MRPPLLAAPTRDVSSVTLALPPQQLRNIRQPASICPVSDGKTSNVPAHRTATAVYPSLRGRTALVTGGASGIGAAIVRRLAANGVRVAFLDVQRAAGEALATELGTQVRFLLCDVTDVAAVRAAVAEVESLLGPVTALVNNAANDQRYSIDDITPEQWDDSQAINLRQQVFTTQAVLPGMRAAGGGAIVNLSSTAWRWGAGHMVPYTAAKAGVVGLTRSLGAALGADGIRVNAVAPGAVMTERQMRLWYTEEAKADMVARQAIPREIHEDDIADAVVFLCADDSRMITKQLLTVDGGAR
jgi:NAD(P)-dependent dehydrogenase (short-subunit alcohol dehydrogenase family)